MSDKVFAWEKITKTFPGVTALQDVSISLHAGEVHALVGENGAGKSTLVKIIYGLIAPDSGEMKLSGQIFQPKNPRDARKNGIGMVFQHFSLFNALSVFENIVEEAAISVKVPTLLPL